MTEPENSVRKPRPSIWKIVLLILTALTVGAICFDSPRHYLLLKTFSLASALKGSRHVTHLPEIDAVEVCLLRNREPKSSNTNLISGAEVMLVTNLAGASARELAGLWRQLPLISDLRLQALCHYPVYGFRFSRQGMPVLESSFCWQCANLTVPSSLRISEISFNPSSPQATNLFLKLQAFFPADATAKAVKSYGLNEERAKP
jgi:hypothetical protein